MAGSFSQAVAAWNRDRHSSELISSTIDGAPRNLYALSGEAWPGRAFSLSEVVRKYPYDPAEHGGGAHRPSRNSHVDECIRTCPRPTNNLGRDLRRHPAWGAHQAGAALG